MSAKIAHIVEFCKPFGVFVVFRPVFLWCFIRHSCGISSGVFVVFHPVFLRCSVRCFCGVPSGILAAFRPVFFEKNIDEMGDFCRMEADFAPFHRTEADRLKSKELHFLP